MKFILNDLELRAIMGLSKDELRTFESEGLVPAIRTHKGWICSWEGLQKILKEPELSSLNEYLKSTRSLSFKIENRSNYRGERPAFLNMI